MATMRGIDVSSHQGKIDPTKLPQVEFCITKATEGRTYVNPECDRVVQLCRKAGLPWGFYHYARSNDAVSEADFFVSTCWNYFGEGIPAEELPYVKLKFYKGTSKMTGSGIGLAVSDEIVKLHGGELNIESEYGAGTVVTILLPRYVPEQAETKIGDQNV